MLVSMKNHERKSKYMRISAHLYLRKNILKKIPYLWLVHSIAKGAPGLKRLALQMQCPSVSLEMRIPKLLHGVFGEISHKNVYKLLINE